MKEKQESVEDRFDKEFYTTKTDRSSIKAFIQKEILKAQEESLDEWKLKNPHIIFLDKFNSLPFSETLGEYVCPSCNGTQIICRKCLPDLLRQEELKKGLK